MISSPPPIALAPRLTEWQAPNGRWVTRGQLIRIEGETGKWKFLAFVDHANGPHIEVVSNGSIKSIRAFDPARVTTVHRNRQES